MSSNFEIFQSASSSARTGGNSAVITTVDYLTSSISLPNNGTPIAIYLIQTNGITVTLPSALNNKTLYMFISVYPAECNIVPLPGQEVNYATTPYHLSNLAPTYFISDGTSNFLIAN